MRVGVLGKSPEDEHVKQIIQELQRRGVEAPFLKPREFKAKVSMEDRVYCSGVRVDNLDALIVRSMPGGSPEQVFFRMDVLHRLQRLGVVVVNPPLSIEIAADKYRVLTILEDEGIPVPRTVACENFWDAMDAFEELGGDVVVKPLFGSLGRGVMRVEDRDLAYRVFRALQLSRCVYYLQEYIPHGNVDMRMFVVGDRVVASMQRVGGMWKTNISQGAQPRPYSPTRGEEELAVRASRAIGCEYSGVDLVKTKDGRLYVVEVNSMPGWMGLQRVSRTRVVEEVVNHVIQLASR